MNESFPQPYFSRLRKWSIMTWRLKQRHLTCHNIYLSPLLPENKFLIPYSYLGFILPLNYIITLFTRGYAMIFNGWIYCTCTGVFMLRFLSIDMSACTCFIIKTIQYLKCTQYIFLNGWYGWWIDYPLFLVFL